MNVVQRFVILFIFTSVAAQVPPPRRVDITDYCGFQHADDYVRDNNGTSINEFPWVAGLVYKFFSDGALALLCSGTLINRRYVLTAAQCLTHPRESVLVAVRLGEYHIQNVTDCAINNRFEPDCNTAIDYGIEEIIVHSAYNREKRLHDIALIRLDTTINEYSDYIRPICLYPINANYANIGEILYSSGFGLQPYTDVQTEFKKKVSTSLITNQQCAKEFPNRVITENHLCTRDLMQNTDFSCEGDAGAPVMFVTSPPPKWHIEGISSWGGQCGFVEPQVYTRVSKYLDWIKQNVRD